MGRPRKRLKENLHNGHTLQPASLSPSEEQPRDSYNDQTTQYSTSMIPEVSGAIFDPGTNADGVAFDLLHQGMDFHFDPDLSSDSSNQTASYNVEYAGFLAKARYKTEHLQPFIISNTKRRHPASNSSNSCPTHHGPSLCVSVFRVSHSLPTPGSLNPQLPIRARPSPGSSSRH